MVTRNPPRKIVDLESTVADQLTMTYRRRRQLEEELLRKRYEPNSPEDLALRSRVYLYRRIEEILVANIEGKTVAL